MSNAIFVFYGFMGSKKKPIPSFPNGSDHDQSLQLTAQTLGDSLQKLFPGDSVQVIQTWSKDQLLAALETAADGTIRQVHVCSHGDSTMLSLAYHFDGGKRLLARAKKFNARTGTAHERGLQAMRDEDAIIAGLFSKALDPKRLAMIKGKHREDASWQIWGCYAGYDQTAFRGIGDTHVDPYLKRFNLGQARIDGVAVDIAKSLGVSVTAARGHGGLEFWHGTASKQVVRNDARTAAKTPFWLWNVAQSTWVTYDSSGSEKAQPEIFQTARSAAELTAGKPPAWLTDIYFKPAPSTRAPAVAHAVRRPLQLSQARTRRGRGHAGVARAFYDDGGPAPNLYGVTSPRAALGASHATASALRSVQWAREEAADAPLPVVSPTLELLDDAHAADGPEYEQTGPLEGNGHTPAGWSEGGPEPAHAAPAPSHPAPQAQVSASSAPIDVPMAMAEDLFSQAPVEEEQDDFRQKLEAALRGEGEYADRAQAQATRASHQAEEGTGSQLPADPFSHLHPDLAQAKTFDLGSHVVLDELDALAEQTLSASEAPPRAPSRAPARSMTRQAPELDELDMLAALAIAEPEAARAAVLDTEGETIATRSAGTPTTTKPALKLGQRVPNASEVSVVGAATSVIRRGTPEFAALVRNDNPDILYKDEEGTGADLMMTPRLAARLNDLAILVGNEWAELKLRVTEAWDEDMEHSKNSLHYEARAADLTVSDRDAAKLGRLAQLAVDADIDFVFYEDSRHVHVSVKKTPAPKPKTDSSDESSEEKTP